MLRLFTRRLGRALAPLVVAAAVLAAGASGASAFEIDQTSALLPGLVPDGDSAVHEDVTAEAVRSAVPSPSRRLIGNLVRGVQNTDITHQFDSESHFDNVLMASASGRAVLRIGFATVQARIARALTLAKGNDEFLDPHFVSFRDIAGQVSSTFTQLVADRSCLTSLRCPTTAFGIAAARTRAAWLLLSLVPNPDPHRPTSPRSPFQPGLLAGQLSGLFRGTIDSLARDVGWALGPHRGKSLAGILGSNHRLVRALEAQRMMIRAYLASQELGHALHATQDFFAHSNYVELIANVPVGQPISGMGTADGAIRVPADFTEEQIGAVLGDRVARLESGAVRTIWLLEGDYCLGDGGSVNLFNPLVGFRVPAVRVRGVKVFPGTTISAAGHNPRPPRGFHYCHYSSSAVVGLNKDGPGGNEPSHRNFAYARGAAVRMSAQILRKFMAALGVPTGPPAQGDVIRPGEVLNPGQSISSRSGRYRFVYQSDGNLVLYDGNAALWASHTRGRPLGVVIMQGDGNLVIYTRGGKPIWQSNTWRDAGSRLVVQDDGNVVIYRPDGRPVWATNTWRR